MNYKNGKKVDILKAASLSNMLTQLLLELKHQQNIHTKSKFKKIVLAHVIKQPCNEITWVRPTESKFLEFLLHCQNVGHIHK